MVHIQGKAQTNSLKYQYQYRTIYIVWTCGNMKSGPVLPDPPIAAEKFLKNDFWGFWGCKPPVLNFFDFFF